MKNIKLGDQVYEGVQTVRLDTAEGGTVDYAPYEETFTAGRVEGYNAGKEAGLEEGFDNGKAAGIEEGIKTEYDRFWDAYQRSGNLRVYVGAFAGHGWHPDIFQPKYDIICEGDSRRMFSDNAHNIDLIDHLSGLGIRLDTAGATNLTEMFRYNGFTRVPEINTVGCDTLVNLCYYPSRLWYIENIVLREDGSQTIDAMTAGASLLTHLRISGTIGKNANFSANPLDLESMKSVIGCLKNYAGTADAAKYKVTFSPTCWETLDADGANAPDGNTWRDYVETTLGWLT